jgi:beta-glucosidase
MAGILSPRDSGHFFSNTNKELNIMLLMKPRMRSFALALILCKVSGLYACSASSSEDPVEAQIDEILAKLTLEQKVGQMVQAEIQHVTPDDVRKYQLGSVLNGGGVYPTAEKHSSIQDWVDLADAFYLASTDTSDGGAGIPVIWGTDAVHGHNNVVGATLFPHNIGLGAADDPDLVRRIAEATAKEVAATGIDWTFAPTLAVVQDARWGRTYESYSSDPELVTKYARPMVEGLQGTAEQLRSDPTKVLATAKHYVGDGGTFRGIDRGDTRGSLEEVLSIHGRGYPAAIEAGVLTVMASYNSWNGDKLHGNKTLLTDVLKGDMGFDGFVISDWNAVDEVDGCEVDSCARAINAGVDMIMVPEQWKSLLQNTIAQVRNGEIPMARIDDAVRRILRVKIRAGLFERGLPSTRAAIGRGYIGHPDHRAIAREAVRKSLVLLKNEGDLLPLNANQDILVAGSGAHDISKQSGGWSVTWQGTQNVNSDFPGATSIYEGIRAAAEAAGGSATLSIDGSFNEQPDVAIVVFGEDPYAEGAGDREHLVYQADSKSDLELLSRLRAAGIPVVSVFISGRPLCLNEEIEASNAFVAAWLPGTEGGGVADVLFRNAEGQVAYDFTGRLSFDWPETGLNNGDQDQPVAANLFPTGYGLSYGTLLSQEIGE